MFAKALAASSTNPPTQPGQKRARDGSASASGPAEDEPSSKRRVSGGVAVPTGPRAGAGSEKKNLLDRMGGVQANEARQNQDAFQSKIDNLTQGSAAVGASLGMPQQQPFAPQRQQPMNQQRGQYPNGPRHNQGQMNNNMGGFGGQMGMGDMGMGGMGMGGMNMGVQEMMVSPPRAYISPSASPGS